MHSEMPHLLRWLDLVQHRIGKHVRDACSFGILPIDILSNACSEMFTSSGRKF